MRRLRLRFTVRPASDVVAFEHFARQIIHVFVSSFQYVHSVMTVEHCSIRPRLQAMFLTGGERVFQSI